MRDAKVVGEQAASGVDVMDAREGLGGTVRHDCKRAQRAQSADIRGLQSGVVIGRFGWHCGFGVAGFRKEEWGMLRLMRGGMKGLILVIRRMRGLFTST